MSPTPPPEWFTAELPRHQAMLRRFAEKALRDSHAAEDVVQETLMEALRHAHRLREPEKLAAWLRAIAYSRVIRHHRRRRWHGWQELHEEFSAARGRTAETLIEVFDSLFAMLKEAGVGFDDALAAVLRFGMEWTPTQIAAVLRTRPSTIHTRIQRAKRKLGAGAARPITDPEWDIQLKIAVGAMLANTAYMPLEGELPRRASLLEEANAILRLTLARHPKHPHLLAALVRLTCMRLQVSGYANDGEPSAGAEAWRRDTWSESLRRDLRIICESLLALKPPRVWELDARYAQALYLPRRNEDVDWRQLLRICEEQIRRRPEGSRFAVAAHCHGILHGPLRAARYLDAARRRKTMRHHWLLDWQTARYYMSAGFVGKARPLLERACRAAPAAATRRDIQRLLRAAKPASS